MAFEEVQDERGLVGAANGGRTEDTHSAPLPAPPKLGFMEAYFAADVRTLSNANVTTTIIKSDVLLVEKKHSKAGFVVVFRKSTAPAVHD